MRHWLDLSGPGMEDALYDMACLRQFARIDLGRETAPDETATCKFQHVLEGAGLGERLFHLVSEYLTENRLFASKGALVDATLIERPRTGIRRSDATRTCARRARGGNGISG
ncbi:transposase [Candidatus Spongiihabitans sp.]|uniref:transposase n=1 Tax=Candidatus Spongiihabitans sp. TaxID=3101308 RepID=UPI003C6FDC16